MTGPRFLSIIARDIEACGGAHPESDTLAMVFDLNTGRPVNWLDFIANSAHARAHVDLIADGSAVGAVTVPELRDMGIDRADKDCKGAFLPNHPQSYQLWPDAKSDTLVAEPFDLAHVVAACAEDLALTPDQARKLGFSETLLLAIHQAHRKFSAPSGNRAAN